MGDGAQAEPEAVQQLVMTPQLQQAIKLLQLSRMELLEQVREEMEQNPLLEQPDETARGRHGDKAPGEASLEAANAEAPADAERPRPENADEVKGDERRPPEIDWEAYLNSYQFNEPTTASNKGNVATDDLPSLRGQPGQEGGPVRPPRRAAGHAEAERGRAPHRDAHHRQPRRRRLPQAAGRRGRPADPPGQRGRRLDRVGRADAAAASSSSTRRAAARATCRSACSSRRAR